MNFIEKNRKALTFLLLFAGILTFVFYWRTAGGDQAPGDYEVKKGNYRLEDGQFDLAVAEFNKALEIDDDHLGAHLGLAVTYLQTDQTERALAKFNRIIEIDPEFAVAFANRGIIHDRQGRFDQAVADYRKALELDGYLAKGPGFLWRFMRNIEKAQPTIKDRADYLEAELEKPPEERLLRVPDLDDQQRMYKAR